LGNFLSVCVHVCSFSLAAMFDKPDGIEKQTEI